ncbi:hypothetical protein [Porphyrobacter sp. AAP82]|uniref:hypothetical protein n=1 Tax=Porphyrobacter sp. AAP82 TaxID=1248917 RepID=UPI0003785C9B|nr:hypothetical protein [Porphyrobacter sp. AAP82]
MRKTLICAVSVTALTLAACSKPAIDDGTAGEEAMAVAEQAATGEPAPPAPQQAAKAAGKALPELEKIPTSLPRLAYEFDYR